MEWLTSYLVKLLFTCTLMLFLPRIVKWLIHYIKTVRVVNKIHSPYSMVPFLGNAHQLKAGSGKFLFFFNSSNVTIGAICSCVCFTFILIEFFTQMIEEVAKIKTNYIARLWLGTHPVVVLF